MAVVLCCVVGLMTVPHIYEPKQVPIKHTTAAILQVISVNDTLHLVTGVVADCIESFCTCGLFANRKAAP